MNRTITSLTRRGLVVSCQLDRTEPLHTPQHCALFAQAANMGGAAGIRADGLDNIKEIRATVRLPVIGCIRTSYHDDVPLSTPTLEEAEALARVGATIVAIDGTSRQRPVSLFTGTDTIRTVRERHPEMVILADISTREEGIEAVRAGADALSTVLFGRTPETFEAAAPIGSHIDLIRDLVSDVEVPVFAEGFIWSPEEAAEAMEAGAYGAIVGGAITRPRILTKLYSTAIEGATR